MSFRQSHPQKKDDGGNDLNRPRRNRTSASNQSDSGQCRRCDCCGCGSCPLCPSHRTPPAMSPPEVQADRIETDRRCELRHEGTDDTIWLAIAKDHLSSWLGAFDCF